MAGKRQRPRKKQHQAPGDAAELQAIMLDGQGLEPITDELIAELVSKGSDPADLRKLQAEGWQYSRARGSFFSPPELGGD